MVAVETYYNGFIIEIVSHPSVREYYEIFGPDGSYHGIAKEKTEAKKRINHIIAKKIEAIQRSWNG